MGKERREDNAFLSQLIIFNRFKICVEIGVLNGDTTQHLCRATQVTGGHVYGFDCWSRNGLKNQFSYPGTQQKAEENLRRQGFSNFTLQKINTLNPEFAKILAQKCPCIDFAFLDGDHSYLGVKSDFDAIYKLLSPTGIIAFHDTLKIDGCREFILDLRTRYFDGTYDVVDFPWGLAEKRVGLTLLVKRSFPIVNMPITKICGSFSAPKEIIAKETKWFFGQQVQNKPEEVNVSIEQMKFGPL